MRIPNSGDTGDLRPVTRWSGPFAGAPAPWSAGDVIVEINGDSIESSRELRTVVASLGSDAEARLVVLRSGERTELSARLAELLED